MVSLSRSSIPLKRQPSDEKKNQQQPGDQTNQQQPSDKKNQQQLSDPEKSVAAQ